MPALVGDKLMQPHYVYRLKSIWKRMCSYHQKHCRVWILHLIEHIMGNLHKLYLIMKVDIQTVHRTVLRVIYWCSERYTPNHYQQMYPIHFYVLLFIFIIHNPTCFCNYSSRSAMKVSVMQLHGNKYINVVHVFYTRCHFLSSWVVWQLEPLGQYMKWELSCHSPLPPELKYQLTILQQL